jgi:hypothetical protein
MLKAKPPKLRRCASCKDYFMPKRIKLKLQQCCTAACELTHAEATANKDFFAETRAMRKCFNDKDPKWWENKTEAKCNQFIRLRDAGRPCISCGTTSPLVEYCAGHYVPKARSAALRFNEFNINLQCNEHCNRKNSGNLIPYRKALIERYGVEKVDWLEISHARPCYRIDDYKRIYAYFSDKIKELKCN